MSGRTTLNDDSTRTTAAEVRDYCDKLTGVVFDVDGDGKFGPNDVLLFRRWDAGGWTDEDLMSGRTTLNDDSTRTTAADIKIYLEMLTGFANSK